MRFTGERWAGDDLVPDPRHESRYSEYAVARQYARGKVVLDIGSGDGCAAFLLAEESKEVIGVEVAREAVELARQRYQRPNLRFQQMSGTQLGFPDNTFDLITSFQVIEHVPEVEVFVDEMIRVLKPDGRLLVTTPNRLTSIGENPYHVQEYSPDEFRTLFDGRFGEVTILGCQGSAAAEQHWRLRGRVVRGLLRLDVLRLRHRLPRRLILRVYPFGYRVSWVIRRFLGKLMRVPQELTQQDFLISEQCLDRALWLAAVAVGPVKAALGPGAGIVPRTDNDDGSGVLGDARSAHISPLGQGRDI
ncbi:MAG: class I SAM-dependent methyltransferase [Candidatus Rokubacteria bacterium]|nr:class I SAM-dependent methyltransferase [Candidatus Rokubacteria bacterium]